MKTTMLALGCVLVAMMVYGGSDNRAGAQGEGVTMTSGQDETSAQRNARMKWFREAKFGMFIHWGVYSVPAGVHNGKKVPGLGEWIMCFDKIPVAEYARYAGQFNPVKFNAEEWVKTAKDAGMKYIVITAKHHDGFAMFKSEASPFNMVDATPYKKDVIKELSAACEKAGMPFGVYYSQAQDWHHQGGAASRGYWDEPAQGGDMTEYIKTIAVPQVKELLSNYGRISILWWDTPKNMTRERAELLLPLLKLQPGIIWNNRLGGGYKGDTETPEQQIPPQGYPGRDWETCMTMNDTWGYKTDDQNWKSAEIMIRNLCDIASKGGNYLLNVGPTSEGLFPEPIVARLQEVGKWMKVNGEAIYGAGATPFGDECGSFSLTKKNWKHKPVFDVKWEWRCTSKPSDVTQGTPARLYFHIFKWPGATFEVANFKGKAMKAYMLADGTKTALRLMQGDGRLTVVLPQEAPDKIASVLCVELE